MSVQQPVSPLKTGRLDFIDLLRGWAVIVMIEVHVFNATLTSEAMGAWYFEYIKFINGLVAPSFLFASGLAFAITTRRKLNEYLSFGKPLFRQIGRLLFILAIGYLLHLPKFNFDQLLTQATERSWRIFFQADVLQCIAMSLLCMQLLLVVLRSERSLYSTLLGLGIAIIFLTPVIWGIDFWPLLPAPLAGYMNGIHFQFFPGFPVFPWTAFVFAGAVTGYLFLESRSVPEVEGQNPGETAMMIKLLWWAPAVILVSALIEPALAGLYPVYDYWKFSPSFTLLRIGIVMILCATMYFYEKKRTVSPRSLVTLIGRESLIVYAIHLLLIYGNFGTFNFVKTVGHSFGYGAAIVTMVVLEVLMVGLAYSWSRVKRERPRWKMLVQYGTLVVLIAVFFFGPGE
jgi:uncharacterized membrane protein